MIRADHRPVTQDAVRREYRVLAASYDRIWARYIRDSTALALAEFPTSPALRVLDIGCGTGVLLRRALDADATRSAIGVDITVHMLRHAAQRLPSTVPLVCASGDTVPLRTASADLVVSTNALHYMRDPMGMLREAYRLLVPGGTVIVGDWCRDYWTMRAFDRVLRWIEGLPAGHRSRVPEDDRADVHRAPRTKLDALRFLEGSKSDHAITAAHLFRPN